MKVSTISAIALLMLVFAVKTSMAQEASNSPVPNPKLDIIEAVHVAQKAEPGTVSGIHLDEFDDLPAYLAYMDTENGVALILIDGSNGDVLAKSLTTGATDEAVSFLLDATGSAETDVLPPEEAFIESAEVSFECTHDGKK